MIRAVVFDFNGVLVDDERVHFELLRDVLAEEGIAISEREYHDVYLGFDDRGCFETALIAAGRPAPPDWVEALIARKAGRYVEAAEAGLRIFPGASACLSMLADRWPIAICSGALRAEIRFALERMGVADRVGPIVSAEDTTNCKPDPEGYLLALAALRAPGGGGPSDLREDECLVVEDSLAGIASARGAGMWALGVAHTYAPDEMRDAGAFAVLDAIAALTPAWLDANAELFRGDPDDD